MMLQSLIKFDRHKLLKIWAQSFLPGVPQVIIGYRDDQGYVQTVEHLKTMEIPRMVRGKQGMWEAGVCLNFADALLEWLRTKMTVDDPEVVYTIQYQPETGEVRLVGPERGGTLVFVHDWFRT